MKNATFLTLPEPTHTHARKLGWMRQSTGAFAVAILLWSSLTAFAESHKIGFSSSEGYGSGGLDRQPAKGSGRWKVASPRTQFEVRAPDGELVYSEVLATGVFQPAVYTLPLEGAVVEYRIRFRLRRESPKVDESKQLVRIVLNVTDTMGVQGVMGVLEQVAFQSDSDRYRLQLMSVNLESFGDVQNGRFIQEEKLGFADADDTESVRLELALIEENLGNDVIKSTTTLTDLEKGVVVDTVSREWKANGLPGVRFAMFNNAQIDEVEGAEVTVDEIELLTK